MQRLTRCAVQDDLVVGTGTGLTSFSGFGGNVVVNRFSAAGALMPDRLLTLVAAAVALLLSLFAARLP
jgi:hypothetical protein